MFDYFGKLNKNIIDQIQYRGTMVTGEITKDNEDGTYDVKIAQADKAYPHVETAFPGMVFGVGEVVLITFEYGNKEMPRILGYAKRIVQHPIDVESDYSGEGGDPIATVETLDAYLITSSTSYLEGRISLSGGAGNCTRRGFKYGLTTIYGLDIHSDGDYGSGNYAIQVTELTDNTIYHFRAYIIDENGDTLYGEDKTFITSEPEPFSDIGSPAIGRDDNAPSGYTWVLQDNPAKGTGIITSIEIYADSGYGDLENCEVATFYVVSGNNLSTRDTKTIGTVISGSKQTFPVNIDVVIGDYIGIYYTSGRLEREQANGTGVGFWSYYGNGIPSTNRTFTLAGGGDFKMKHSFYGTGE